MLHLNEFRQRFLERMAARYVKNGPELDLRTSDSGSESIPELEGFFNSDESFVGKLQRSRSEFVKRVSLSAIKGLLDDLLHHEVFTTEDKDSVMENQTSTTDRARCLIDMVIGKGERASQIMSDSMKDRNLYFLSLGLISSPTAGVGYVQNHSERDLSMVDSGSESMSEAEWFDDMGNSIVGELQRIRFEFVHTVSDPVIKGLLDDLLHHEVLSTEGKLSVENQTSTQDRAHCLIEMVVWNGERASQKMIDSMKVRDPELCITLGLISSPSAGLGHGDDKTVVKPRKQRSDRNNETRSAGQALSNEQLLQVAETLGQEWEQAAIHLGLKKKDLDLIEAEQRNVTMQKYKMLLLWKFRRPPGEATAQDLLSCLKDLEDLPCETHQLLKGHGDDKTVSKPRKRRRNRTNKTCTTGQDLSDEQLLKVAGPLVQEWEPAALLLGLKNKDLDDIKTEYRTVAMQKQKMLLLWKRRCPPGKATAQDLLRGLEELEDLPDETHQLLKDLPSKVESSSSETRLTKDTASMPLMDWDIEEDGSDSDISAEIDEDDIEDEDLRSEVESSSPGTSLTKDTKSRDEEEGGSDSDEDSEGMHFKSQCEKCKAAQQSPENEKVTPRKISKWSFQAQLKGEGTYECSVTGLVFEVSEQVLVRYSVLSWFKFSEFLHDSWKPAGSIFDLDVVNKDSSVLKFIHYPHSLCLAEPEHELSFSVLHVKGRHANIESTVDFTASHVKWRVSSLSPVGPIVPSSVKVKHHALVLVYKELKKKYQKDFIFHVFLASNDGSEIQAIKKQLLKSRKKCIKIYKPATCRLEEKFYHLTSKPERKIEPPKLEFVTELLPLKGFSEARFSDRPPFRLFLMDPDCDEPLWSATIREDDLNGEENLNLWRFLFCCKKTKTANIRPREKSQGRKSSQSDAIRKDQQKPPDAGEGTSHLPTSPLLSLEQSAGQATSSTTSSTPATSSATQPAGQAASSNTSSTPATSSETQPAADRNNETRSTGQALSDKQLLKVAETLGQEWEQAAIYLELKNKDLQDIKADHRTVAMRKQKMLVLWKNRRPPGEATAQDLLRGLEDLKDLPCETHQLLKDMMKH